MAVAVAMAMAMEMTVRFIFCKLTFVSQWDTNEAAGIEVLYSSKKNNTNKQASVIHISENHIEHYVTKINTTWGKVHI